MGKTEILSELEECVKDSYEPENMYTKEALGESIRVFVHELSELEMKVFIRRYYYLDDVEQIGHRYHVKQVQVELMLSELRKKLQGFLEREGFLG